MPQSHPSSVSSEEPRGDANVPSSPCAPAPPPARDALETSWIDEWGREPAASFPDAWGARLKASVSSVPAACAEGPTVVISGVPDAWSVGPAASIFRASEVAGAGEELDAPDALESWGLGPDLIASYALIPAARGLRASASTVEAPRGAQDVRPGAPARVGHEAAPTRVDGPRRRGE